MFCVYTFNFADCFIKCFLIKLYCLFLYGCIWSLDSKHLNNLQIALNKVMRKVWNLPSQSHVPIVLSVSGVLVYIIIIVLFTPDS